VDVFNKTVLFYFYFSFIGVVRSGGLKTAIKQVGGSGLC